MGTPYPNCAAIEQGLGERAWIERPPFSDHTKLAIDTLYQNIFCSLVRFQDAETAVLAYVSADGSQIKQIVLFSRERCVVNVLNELFSISDADLEKFVIYVFNSIPDVELINFPSVSQRRRMLPFPNQSHNATEDIVVRLPSSAEAYMSSLSKNTRESIRRYQKRITRELGDVHIAFYEGPDVDVEQIQQVVRLSKARILKKNEVPTHTARSLDELGRLVSEYGVALIVKTGDTVIAGVLGTLVRQHFFMHVVAHDPALDGFRLGKICCYLSICNAIERGAKEYHMLSGEYEYKYRFLGERRDYERLTVYRSRLAILKNFGVFVHREVRGRGRKVKKNLIKWRDKWTQ
jgi:hypothetical protein